MAFTDQIAQMQGVVYAQYGIAAVWAPAGQGAVPVTLLPDQGDAIGAFPGLGRQVVARNVFRVRVSELAAALTLLAMPLTDPAKGDGLVVAGQPLTIIAKPMRHDPRQTEWTLEAE